jgi:hypothetical protein
MGTDGFSVHCEELPLSQKKRLQYLVFRNRKTFGGNGFNLRTINQVCAMLLFDLETSIVVCWSMLLRFGRRDSVGDG